MKAHRRSDDKAILIFNEDGFSDGCPISIGSDEKLKSCSWRAATRGGGGQVRARSPYFLYLPKMK